MTPFASRVDVRELGPVTVLALPTPARNVVSIRLSFDTHPDFAAGEELLQDMAAALLDKGTGNRDRFEVAAALEDRGARISFSGAGTTFRASGRMLTADLGFLVPLLGEMLCRPAFDGEEVVKAVGRMEVAVRRAMSDTGHRSAAALSRHVFPITHPGYSRPEDETLEDLGALTTESLRSFHASRFRGPVRLVAVGDLDADLLAAAVREAFLEWPDGTRADPEYADDDDRGPGFAGTPIADRPNLDVRLGHGVQIRRNDPDYDALRLGVFALGGNFSARLMARVRDELGLTYGIGSSLSGTGVSHGGLWETSVTLSADRLGAGLEATRTELDRFVTDGITTDELSEKQATLAGRYLVGLATTGGLASTILSAEENGFGVAWLDEYPGRIGALTLADVNGAITKHLDPDRLFVSVAGTLED